VPIENWSLARAERENQSACPISPSRIESAALLFCWSSERILTSVYSQPRLSHAIPVRLHAAGDCMTSMVRGENRVATLSLLGFRLVKSLKFKHGSFKTDTPIRRRKNKGMRHFSKGSGLGIELRTSGAWRLLNKNGRLGRGHTLYKLQTFLAALKNAR
jgi:hypothetical protein